ncbi:hypothetical protein [Kitasatospora sp. NPDC017646]|uniref:hypothetical protein n=1 Tax=Kitasatospora sp. NPDC017646 TaxID=3364024 RepID=UPI00379954F4
MPAPQPRNGLGVAAMVLGIVGTVLSLAVTLFRLSWLPAVLALICKNVVWTGAPS